MKPNLKFFGLLLSLTATIYILRQNGLTLSGKLSQSFRRVLDDQSLRETLCSGVDLDQVFMSDELSYADKLRMSLHKLRGGNPLITMLENKTYDNPKDNYIMPLLKFIAPWAALFVVTLLVFIALCCNWCCMYGFCKPCASCQCCKEGQDDEKRKKFQTFTILLMFGTVISSAVGILVARGIPPGMTLTLCNLVNVVDELTHGQLDENWVGTDGAIKQLNDVLNVYNSSINHLTLVGNSFTAMNQAYTDAVTSAHNLWDQNKGHTVVRAKPLTIDYIPTYLIDGSLGPETKIATSTYQIVEEMKAKKEAVTKQQPIIDAAITDLKGHNYYKILKAGVDQADMIEDNLDTITKPFGNGKAKNLFDITGNATAGIFMTNIVLAQLGIIAVMLVSMKKLCCNKLLYIDSCLLLWFAMVTWLLSIVLVPSSIVLSEACEVLDLSLNDETFFNDNLKPYLEEKNGRAGEIFQTCLHGDGDMLAVLGVGNFASAFNIVFDSLGEVNKVYQIDATTPVPSVTITNQANLLADMVSGKISDSQETTDDLKELNDLVHGSCTTFDDLWQLGSLTCPANMYKFVDTDPSTKNLPNPTCIGFDQWKEGTTHSVATRYVAASFTGCDPIGGVQAVTYAQNYVPRFKANRAAVANMFKLTTPGGAGEDFKDVMDKEGLFSGHVKTVANTFNDVQIKMKPIRDILLKNETGLLNNMNCNFIGTGMKRLQSAMCIGFVSNLYQVSVALIICSFCSLAGGFFMFCVAKRKPKSDYKPVRTETSTDHYPSQFK